MADKVIVGATVQIGTGNSNANIKEVNKNLGETKAALKSTDASTKDSTVNFSKFKDGLSAIPGPAAGAVGGIEGINTAFNLLRTNPIVFVLSAIAGVLITLFNQFRKMEGVSDSLGKAFGTLSGLIGKFVTSILTPLIDLFVSFVELFRTGAIIVLSLFSKEMALAAKRSGELAEELDDLDDVEQKSAITRAESNRKLQEARELADNANIPIQERIKALQEAGRIESAELQNSITIAEKRARKMLEQIALEIGAKDKLIQKIREGSAEELRAARDEINDAKNVNKEKIKEIDGFIISAENQGATLSKIEKKTNTAITGLQRDEQKRREDIAKEAADKAKAAREKAAAERQKEIERQFQAEQQLIKIQQENILLQTKAGFERDKVALEQKIKGEEDALRRSFDQKTLKQAEFNKISNELVINAGLRRKELQDKIDADLKLKEEAFNKEIAEIRERITISAITDAREKEKDELNRSFEDRLAIAEEKYKADETRLAEIRLALNEEFRVQLKAQQDKFDAEDEETRINKEIAGLEKKLADDELKFEEQRVLIDKEISLQKELFDKKLVTEEQYTNQVEVLSKKRIQVDKLEKDAKQKAASDIGNALGVLAGVIGKQTAAGKAFAIADATINTLLAGTRALAAIKTAATPVQAIAGIATMAAVIASGFKTVRDIVKVQVPGGGGGGGGGSAEPSPVTATAPITPQIAGTIIDQQSLGQINNATSRAYILDIDVQNNRERNERLNRAARLG